jgi:phosphotriesterase-related protein
LAEAGATLKWCFGYEAPPRPGLATATDAERADAVTALLAEGHQRQVLACGVWTKSALHAHGGWGYDHLPTKVVPMLRDRGLTPSDLNELLITEPRRLLDRTPGPELGPPPARRSSFGPVPGSRSSFGPSSGH